MPEAGVCSVKGWGVGASLEGTDLRTGAAVGLLHML